MLTELLEVAQNGERNTHFHTSLETNRWYVLNSERTNTGQGHSKCGKPTISLLYIVYCIFELCTYLIPNVFGGEPREI